ncbi:MAG: class D sortase [Thermoanaerobaculia bacterium]
MRWLRLAERCAWGAGLALLAFYVVARSHGNVAGAAGVARFLEVRAALADSSTQSTGEDQTGSLAIDGTIDFSLWAEGRVEAYGKSLEEDLDLPLALLRIPKIALEVPVHEGTEELILNRAVGSIAGTARPGDAGNIGIAGHRDGFFRGLKELEPGDAIEIVTLARTDTYLVDKISIVDPVDVHVLNPSPLPAVTLVTCYPFYHVGKAPRRYIVRATLQESPLASGTGKELPTEEEGAENRE